MNKLKTFIFRNIIPFVGKCCQKKNQFCNVIYYHDVVRGPGETYMRTNIDVFKRQMSYIAENGYETLRFDNLESEEKLKFGKKKILIAFDDGWLSNYVEIFDFMKQLGLKYNVFLAMGKIGQDPDYLDWDKVREMYESGLVGFGAHTHTHPDMSDLSKIDFELEINHADELFEKKLGFAPMDFCYPFGYYSEESNHVLEQKSGYKRIYTSRMMYSYEENGKIVFGRNGINNDWPFKVFKHSLDGHYNVFTNLISKIH